MRTVQDLVVQGQAAYARNDLVTAGALFKQALSVNPVDNTASVLYAFVCARSGKRDVAIEYLRNALGRDADLFEAHAAIASLLFASGKPDEALHHGHRAIELQPENSQILYNVGCDLTRINRIEDSLGYFQRAVELSPANSAYHLALAAGLSEIGRNTEAVPIWQNFIELAPMAAIGWVGLGRVRLALSDFDAALECGRRAVELDGHLLTQP